MLAGSKVLLTGADGQIGRAVARRFAGSCEIWGVSSYSAPGSREEAEACGVKPLALDIAADGLQQLPTDFDYVLHFAEALARKSGAAIPPEESRNAATAA
jgi:nucleoside-diphosphate-sugar epimerase